jgi:hypothetical protein
VESPDERLTQENVNASMLSGLFTVTVVSAASNFLVTAFPAEKAAALWIASLPKE